MNIIERTYTLKGTLQKRAKTDSIYLHHAVYNGPVEDIDRMHKNNGWTCIGYHFYVRKDGSIYRGRREDSVGAHAYGFNNTSIGICAEGNFEKDIMSETQKNAIKELVAYLKSKYGITIVKRHKDVNATACPGKNYPFDEIVNGKVENTKIESKTENTEGYKVSITTDVLRIRDGAGTNCNIVGTVKRGEIYTIVEEKNGQGASKWGRLKSGAGWISLDYTDKRVNNPATATSKYVLGKYVVNTTKGLNVRSDAGTNYKIVKAYANGTRFDTYEIKNNWARTPSGWVCLDYCKLVETY